MAKLYPREREVVKLLIEGFSIKEAADRMGIVASAARQYAWRARRRLNCRSTEQMMFQLGQEACRS